MESGPAELLSTIKAWLCTFSIYCKLRTRENITLVLLNDPERRLKFHNSTEKGFTARFKPWRIVYVKGFSSLKLARQAERRVKSWKSRGRIQKLIKGGTSL